MLSALLACYTHRKKSVDSDCTATMRTNAEHSARVVLITANEVDAGLPVPGQEKNPVGSVCSGGAKPAAAA
jgi:hypothetical protein